MGQTPCSGGRVKGHGTRGFLQVTGWKRLRYPDAQLPQDDSLRPLDPHFLGRDFNRPLQPGMLPETLRHLTFGDDFNQQLIEGGLPKSLETLTFLIFSER